MTKKLIGVMLLIVTCGAGVLIGLVVLVSSVAGTTTLVACAVSTVQSSSKVGHTTTTTTPVDNANCGAAAAATLPDSSVVADGEPVDYVLPVDSTTAEKVAVSYALAQLGKPYLWGGSGPIAYDCSGLTMMAWAQAGVTLLHYTGDQMNEGATVGSYADISLGDLVLVPGSDGTIRSPGHVGIYVGGGLVESAVDVQYGIIIQPYAQFVRGGLSGIRHVA